MFLDECDFDSVHEYLGKLIKHVYAESGIRITCVISSDESEGIVSSDGAEAPVHLTTALIRVTPDYITDKRLFDIIKRARAVLPNKDVQFEHNIKETL